MIHSMTGFARAQADFDHGQLQWEIRSVNHRYLELHLKLPEGLRALEPELREIVSGQLRRGKVDATLQLVGDATNTGVHKLNLDYARELIEHSRALSEMLDEPARISALGLMKMPGVLQELEPDIEDLKKASALALETAVIELCEAREREGTRLQDALETRLQGVTQLVAKAREQMPRVLEMNEQRLRERIQQLALNPDNDRLEQELVLQAQKLDIHEELDRLDAHVAEIRSSFTMPPPIGRRLDFLMQELNREANTLAAKSADATTSNIAVELKVLIEQMREQVQNIE